MRRNPPAPKSSAAFVRLSSPGTKRRVLVAALVALSISTSLSLITYAQSAGPNVNVLPIVLPPTNATAAQVTAAALVGDLYLQRQLEPTIAVSTRNPSHLLAFFNDYRAVDIQADPGLGEVNPGTITLAWRYVQKFFARLIGKPSPPKGKAELPALAAAQGEAWIGGSRSYDGGRTWSGMFLPGGPFDNTIPSQASPVYGLTTGTDPVLAAGPCGRFYVGFLAFNRGGASTMAVAIYEDGNDEHGGDTIRYIGTKVLESANNAQFGYFLDKPAIAVDMHRGASAGCGHNVYVSYTTFNGQSKDGKAQTKITVARSTNSGQTFSVTKLNQPYQQGQGTALAVDPRPGTPQSGGGGTLYIAFRHFHDPDTILVHKSTNFGQTFSGQPVNILAGHTPSTLQKYDAPTIGTAETTNPEFFSFRSLAFPSIAVAVNPVNNAANIVVAFAERVGIDPLNSATFRRPSAAGSPRIVVMQSTDGNNWKDINGTNNSRLAVDVGDRDIPNVSAPAPGYGFLPQHRPSGPQIQPYLSFGAGKLMMLYYESRGFMSRELISPADFALGPNFATGFDRLYDARAALLNPSTGALLNDGSTAQVSRYTLKTSADWSGGETLDDVLTANGEPRVDRANKPTSRSGTSPFKGDYLGLTPAVSMVPDGSGWRWAINAADVPGSAFHGIFADNRNLVPPANPDDPDLYQVYSPPFTEGCSVNAGSRNTDVFVSRIDGDLVLTAPTTFTQLANIQRTFPIVVSNGAATTRYFKLSFSGTGGDIASFRQESNVDTDVVLVQPYSSSTRVVYLGDCSSGSCLAPDPPQPVTVLVQQSDASGNPIAGGVSGTVTLNGDASNPVVLNSGITTTEFHAPEIGSIPIVSPEIGSPEIGSPEIGSPEIGSPEIGSPEIGSSAPDDYKSVQDVTWTVSNSGNTNSAYTAYVHLDNAEEYKDEYAFQLIIHQSGGFGTLTNCGSVNYPQDRIISIIANPEIGSPEIGSPEIGSPEIGSPTFAMGPSDSPTSSATGGFAAMSLLSAALQAPEGDGTLKAPKAPESVKITLRAYRLVDKPSRVFNPLVTGNMPVIAIAQQSKDNNNGQLLGGGVAVQGADLEVTSGTPTTPTIEAGGEVLVNAWTLQNIGNITANPGDGTINNSLYLSSDDAFGGEDDVLIGSAGDSALLNAGASLDFPALSVTIPSSIDPGAYHLFIVADDGSQFVTGEVNELNENNNVVLAAVVTVTAPVVNVPPVAISKVEDESVTTSEDTPTSITLTATDANVNDTLTFSIVAPPTRGTLTGTPPDLTYTPTTNLNGADSFTFRASDGSLDSNLATVSINVTAVNDVPTALLDTYSTNEDAALMVATPGVLINDSDVESALTAVLVAGPSHGTLTLNPDGSFTYTPVLNYNGSDSFSYKANDGTDYSNEVSVSIAVNVVNDPPTASGESVSTPEDTAKTIVLAASDVEGSTLTYTLGDPSHGTLSGTAPNVTYTPAANYFGADSFTFQVNDGSASSNVATISITVTAVNDAPVANDLSGVTTNEDTDKEIALSATDVEGSPLTYTVGNPSHGTLLGTAPNVIYRPAANYNGPDSFTFTVSDGAASSSVATVSISVAPINDAPVAASVPPVTTNEDIATKPFLLAATDVEGSPLTYTLSNPSHGSLGGVAPNVTYTPNANYYGADSFTFKVNDGALDSNVVTVSITVTPVNDAPVASNQTQSVVENVPTAITVAATDVEGSPLTYSIGTQPTKGTLSFTAPNVVTYSPQLNYEGPDSFTFKANDGSLDSAPATVSITVVPGLNFNGLLSPYQAPPKFGNLGSSQPIVWQYTLGGVAVDTSMEDPKVTFTKMNATNNNCTPLGDQTAVLNVTYFENSDFPGNSSFQYDIKTNTWQFNWQTGPPVTAGCWSVRVMLPRTGQVNGPFPLRLR